MIFKAEDYQSAVILKSYQGKLVGLLRIDVAKNYPLAS